ncbi:MAG: glucose-1-phosphate adenylyltransferase [Candidatus Omnitrophica bacterium]|nr:glucose-1-phosphate adenylyltransferase [Candidatus Omnitrophota bacterium]
MREVLTFILAGGRGERLDPLTRDRTKPAVPFGGIYRIIDFTLSNCINSGLRRIYVLTQYKSFSLQKHLLAGWDVVSSQLGEFIDVIPAQQRLNHEWYLGTADAIHQNIYAIHDNNPDLILVLAGDHIYKMDYNEMINYHREKGADMTVACVTMPKEVSKDFGVIEVDTNSNILGFEEKPHEPKTIPRQPEHIFASMGIYLFSKDALLNELAIDADNDSSDHDFGKNVIPQMLSRHKKLFVYNFIEKDGSPKYWRDIGTRDAYYQANMDLLNMIPSFDLFDKSWPVRTYHAQYPPVKLVNTKVSEGKIINSIISGGCKIEGGLIEHSVVSPNVRIQEGAHISHSVLMGNAVIGRNAKIKNAIVDKEVNIPANETIGFDAQLDSQRFCMTTSGIVIVPKRMTF